MASTTIDYVCPRCGYKSHRKSSMYNHFFKKSKSCPATKRLIELTDEVKNYVLNNKIYWENLPQTATSLKSTISKALKVACWNQYIGAEKGQAKCICCNLQPITQHHFHCGHVVAEAQGGKTELSNLRPVCDICNLSMRTTDMRLFAQTQFGVNIE